MRTCMLIDVYGYLYERMYRYTYRYKSLSLYVYAYGYVPIDYTNDYRYIKNL